MNIMLLLSLGANGRTQEEIRRTLQFPLYFPPEHDHILMKCALMQYDGVSLQAANAWVLLSPTILTFPSAFRVVAGYMPSLVLRTDNFKAIRRFPREKKFACSQSDSHWVNEPWIGFARLKVILNWASTPLRANDLSRGCKVSRMKPLTGIWRKPESWGILSE